MAKLAPKIRPDISDWSAADLLAWREKHNFTQNEAANAIGIGRQTWLKMETSKRAIDLVYYLACKGYDAEHQA